MRNTLLLLAVSLLCASNALGGEKSLFVTAFTPKGKLLDREALLKVMAPVSREDGQHPALSGLLITDLQGKPVPGRPWWEVDPKEKSKIIWSWDEIENVRISMPWPIRKDGFSTVVLDSGGKGYVDGQEILLNEEIAAAAYAQMSESLKERKSVWEPAYKPSKDAAKLLEKAKKAMAYAHSGKTPRKRAKRFNRALTLTAYAWQQIIFEHGMQIARGPRRGELRWGLSLDETVVDRVDHYEWIGDQVVAAGADTVRLVFRENKEDFTFSKKHSFMLYDDLVKKLRARNLNIMGSVLDSLLWPKDLTPEDYRERTRNLVGHFKDDIRSWEVASEPNGNWLGGSRPLPRETVLLCVQKALVTVKRIDPELETVATLHWWEGTAMSDEYSLFQWLHWAVPRGFGTTLDVIGVSLYPHRHPVGIAYDRIFRDVRRFFPNHKLMLGGYAFGEGKQLEGYWWLGPKNIKDARKDLVALYTGAAAAIPESVGGGFFWPALGQMFQPPHKIFPLQRTYKEAVDRMK